MEVTKTKTYNSALMLVYIKIFNIFSEQNLLVKSVLVLSLEFIRWLIQLNIENCKINN